MTNSDLSAIDNFFRYYRPPLHMDSNWSDLWSRRISQITKNRFPRKSSNISSAFFPFRMQIIWNRFKFWLWGGCVKTLLCLFINAGFNGFAGNLRTRNQILDQPFRSHFHFHPTPPHTVSCKKWNFDKSESKGIRKQSWPNLICLRAC